MAKTYDISDSIKEGIEDYKTMNKVAENTIAEAMANPDGIANSETAPDVEVDNINNVSITDVNKYITIGSYINNFINRAKMIEKKIAATCPDTKDRIEIVAARLKDVVKAGKKVTELTTAEVNEIITVDEKPLSLPFDNVAINQDEYNKTFLEFLYDSTEILDEIYGAINTLKEELGKFKKEVAEIVEQNANITDFTISRMRAAIESPNMPEEDKKKMEYMLKSVEDGYTLSAIKNELESIVNKKGVDSTMYGYSNNSSKTIARAHDIMVKGKPLSKLVEIPFHLLQNIESKVLKDKYANFDNLFIYVFARWIVTHRDNIDVGRRIFISQVSYNLISLVNNKLGDHTEPFKKAIKSVLDIIIDRIPQKMIEKKTNMVK